MAQASNFLIKGQQALAIIAVTKAHHGAVIKQDIVWKDTYSSAKLAECQALFATLMPEERKVHRLVNRYRAANQAVGKLWSKLKLAATHQPLSPAQKANERYGVFPTQSIQIGLFLNSHSCAIITLSRMIWGCKDAGQLSQEAKRNCKMHFHGITSHGGPGL